jgi:hypothetical protein
LTAIIHQSYFSNSKEIELENAKNEIKLNSHKPISSIDKLIYLNQLERHAVSRANKILGITNYQFTQEFRESLGNDLLISSIKIENQVSNIVIQALKKEISLSKYKTKEQIYAAGQYFKEQSNNLGLSANQISIIIDRIIAKKVSSKKLPNNASNNKKIGEEGKIIIGNLRDRNPISKTKVEEIFVAKEKSAFEKLILEDNSSKESTSNSIKELETQK